MENPSVRAVLRPGRMWYNKETTEEQIWKRRRKMEKELELLLQEKFGKSIQDASNEEIYAALLGITKREWKE